MWDYSNSVSEMPFKALLPDCGGSGVSAIVPHRLSWPGGAIWEAGQNRRDTMRKTLLTSAAILGATGGLAVAQNAPNPTQGQYIAPLLGGPSAQNNNNSWASAIPGGAAVPTPGTVVIRLNG